MTYKSISGKSAIRNSKLGTKVNGLIEKSYYEKQWREFEEMKALYKGKVNSS